ncbi:MAG: DUF3105 domain-containing protein [Actinomycetota bacterium]|nr:DUF3105 domain-containing protein [Actinomycetota bacterium]
MSSRQEEKERRRRERLAREAEAAAAERRKRLIGLASGGVLALAIVVAIVVAVAGGGGKSKTASTPKPPVKTDPIPAAKVTNLNAAAKAAGCTLKTFIPGPADRGHVTGTVTYKQNPPVFGPHNPVPAHDGDYARTTPPATEELVHPMEHGRAIIWFNPSAVSAHQVSQLETLFNEPITQGAPRAYKQILVQRPGMPSAVAATTWGQQLTCPRFNDKVFDAIRTFRLAFVDHAPESQIPFPE